MQRSLITQIFLLIFIVSITSSMLFNALADDSYTTTMTQQITTVVTSMKTETVDTTVTALVTRTEVVETHIETQKVIITPTTALVPTQTIIVKPCDNPPCDLTANLMTINTFILMRINSPTTITSTITSSTTVTETIEAPTVDKIVQTTMDLITLTLENVYTSVSIPQQTTGTPTGFDINNLSSNYLTWILGIIIIVLIVGLALRLRQPRGVSPAQREVTVYCVNCGAPISATASHCPKCKAPQ